ncbi:hypothetical protein DFP72DRAFT_793423, partial [Ephemerocybe angulata]
MIRSLKIRGISGEGLCTLQMANALALSGVVTEPTETELADWIWGHKGLGAWKGLGVLGFQLDNTTAVRCAVKATLDHMKKHMSKEDAETLGLGPLFLEHVLCKVKRWNARF